MPNKLPPLPHIEQIDILDRFNRPFLLV